MNTKTTYVYRKQLLNELGLDRNQVTPIVSRAEIFKSLPTGAGYAIQYDYRQAFLITLGCSLLTLGVKFNTVDMILTRLHHFDWITCENGTVKSLRADYILAITTSTSVTHERLNEQITITTEAEHIKTFSGTEKEWVGFKHVNKQMFEGLPYIVVPLQPLFVRINRVFGIHFYESNE